MGNAWDFDGREKNLGFFFFSFYNCLTAVGIIREYD